MKFIIISLLLFISIPSFAQDDYFKGNTLYCPSYKEEAMKLFHLGIEGLHTFTTKKDLKMVANIFAKAYKTDSTFCDAAFFTGYTLRLTEDKYALVYCYIADSLAHNRSALFKINLAAVAMQVGTKKGIIIARKKYTELIQYFPENPEGYYGFALTSIVLGDHEDGLKNITMAAERLKNGSRPLKDTYFLRAILLTLNKQYKEAVAYFEKAGSSYKKTDDYYIYYSLAMLKVSLDESNFDMKKNAKKLYDKIKDKEGLPPDLKEQFVF